MTPSATNFNLPDGGNSDSETSCDVFENDASFQHISDDGYVVISQLGVFLSHPSLMSVSGNTVLHVLTRRTPLQVAKSVIRSVVVNVIYLLSTFRRSAQEGKGYESMDVSRFRLTRPTQADLHISIPIPDCLQDSTLWCRFGSHITPYTPQIRNGVYAFVSRTRLPNFFSKFFFGKIDGSHEVNLLDRFTDWSGSIRSSRFLSTCLYFTANSLNLQMVR